MCRIDRDPELRLHSHHIAHETGRIAIKRSAFDLSVLSDCTLNVASGCVHGMLERYFYSRASIADTSVASFCDELLPDAGLNAWKLECTHGLGHGLAVRSSHDPVPALKQVAQAHSGDWTAVHRFCSALSAGEASACTSGAVEHLIDFDWTTERAAAFCADAPADLRSDCYFSLGARLGLAAIGDVAAAQGAAAEKGASEACRSSLALTRRRQAAGA